MKNILLKFICLISIAFIISGCSINYDLKIKKDNSVVEQAKVTFSSSVCYADEDDAYDIMCADYIDDIKTELTNNYNLPDYNTKIKEDKNEVTATFTHTYPNLSEFIKSNSYKLFFMENNSSGNSFNYNGYKVVQDYIRDQGFENEKISGFRITLTTNKEVKNCNANRVFQNTYVWNMDDVSNDSIEFTLGENKEQKVDKVIDDKKLKNQDISNEKKNIDALLIALFITIVIGALIVTLLLLLKVKKNNRV